MTKAISNTSPLLYLYRTEWLSLDLGPGELAAMALALENPTHVILLDDLLARRTAQAAGLIVWGTLKVLLEGKAQGLTHKIEPFVSRLDNAGMWLADEIRQRILALAGES
jgi:predicted nucleic acid-binding protein